MNYGVLIFVGIIAIIEIFYWCYWLPRNWEKTREAADFRTLKKLYGRDGVIPNMMKKGEL